MRDLFPGYYRPTNDEFADMWRDGTIAFDANMLLNVYRYTPKTRERFFDIVERLQGQIWLPHQAAYEYQEKRLTVIAQQLHAYAAIEKLLEDHLQKLEGELRAFQRHPLVSTEDIIKSLRRTINSVRRKLTTTRAEHPDLLQVDELRDRIDSLFCGKVGASYEEPRLDQVYKDADRRISKKLPPGYMDADKKDNGQESARRYGDVVLWHQLLDYAKVQKKPVIFVTDDTKEDWWLRREGKTYGPRPELVQEMHAQAGVGLYMYQTDRFLEEGQRYLRLKPQQEAIDEAREIRQHGEDISEREGQRQTLPSRADMHLAPYLGSLTDQYSTLFNALSGYKDGPTYTATAQHLLTNLIGSLKVPSTTDVIGNLLSNIQIPSTADQLSSQLRSISSLLRSTISDDQPSMVEECLNGEEEASSIDQNDTNDPELGEETE